MSAAAWHELLLFERNPLFKRFSNPQNVAEGSKWSQDDALLKLERHLATLLFPTRCLGCDAELPPSGADIACESRLVESLIDHWCRGCWQQLYSIHPQCLTCGAVTPVNNPLAGRCSICHGIEFNFESATAVGNYRGLLQRLVVQMKNQHDEQLASQLGQVLGYRLSQVDYLDEVDLVTPVPTHWWRRLKRGFHGSDVVAQTAAETCHLPYSNKLLKCLRSTKKQGTLSNTGRIENVRNAFGLRSSYSVNGLTVLLVDDVMTSGATLSELSRVLRRAGAAKVYVGVIARGARVS